MATTHTTKDVIVLGKYNIKIIVIHSSEEIWFCGKDVATMIGYKDTNKAITKFVCRKLFKRISHITDSYGSGNQKNTIYINEKGLINLSFKSNLSSNAMRDTINLSIKNIKKKYDFVPKEIRDLQDKVNKHSLTIKEHTHTIKKLEYHQKILISDKKRLTKDEIIYIVSTYTYSRKGIFKVGRTKNAMKNRTSGHNVSRIANDRMEVLKIYKVHDSVSMERYIHYIIKAFLLPGSKEFFTIPYDNLVDICDRLVLDKESHNTIVNKVLDKVYDILPEEYAQKYYTKSIPKVFEEDETNAQ